MPSWSSPKSSMSIARTASRLISRLTRLSAPT
jgi:hypothetical protein